MTREKCIDLTWFVPTNYSSNAAFMLANVIQRWCEWLYTSLFRLRFIVPLRVL